MASNETFDLLNKKDGYPPWLKLMGDQALCSMSNEETGNTDQLIAQVWKPPMELLDGNLHAFSAINKSGTPSRQKIKAVKCKQGRAKESHIPCCRPQMWYQLAFTIHERHITLASEQPNHISLNIVSHWYQPEACWPSMLSDGGF